jgi:hypothetical protein
VTEYNKENMFCQKCGAVNKDGAAFCNSCGAALVPLPVQSTTEQKPQNDLVAPKIPTQDKPVSELESASLPIPGKKRGVLFWWAVIVGIIIIFILGAVLISASKGMVASTTDFSKYCTDKYPGTTYNPSTNTCEAIATPTPQVVTTTRTQSPIVTSAQDPIIGVWDFQYVDTPSADQVKYSGSTYANTFDHRMWFKSDGTYQEVLMINSIDSLDNYGTWSAQGGNQYKLTPPKLASEIYIYDPTNDVIYDSESPGLKLTRE